MMRTFAGTALAGYTLCSIGHSKNDNLLIRVGLAIHGEIGDLVVCDRRESEILLHRYQHIGGTHGHGRSLSCSVRVDAIGLASLGLAELDGVLVFGVACLDCDLLLLVIHQQLHVCRASERFGHAFGKANG